jgi:hypothetical protein
LLRRTAYLGETRTLWLTIVQPQNDVAAKPIRLGTRTHAHDVIRNTTPQPSAPQPSDDQWCCPLTVKWVAIWWSGCTDVRTSIVRRSVHQRSTRGPPSWRTTIVCVHQSTQLNPLQYL